MDNKKITLGIFAHANAGKTTLTEQLLARAGVIESAGRVDYGNTITDNLEVEKQRGITVRASLVSFCAGKNIFQLIDTPGHIDFVAEVERAISVLDLAIVVISGVEGVEPQTYAIVNTLIKNNIPMIIFINKLDRVGASLERTEKDIREKFKIENVHIFSGSALKNEGISELFTHLEKYKFETEYKKNLSAYVYQVRIENGLRNTYVKLFGGNLYKKQKIEIEEKSQKIDAVFNMEGNKFVEIEEAKSGDIVILQGVEILAGSWIGEERKMKSLNFHKPLYSVSIVTENKNHQKLVEALKILTIEDPYLDYKFNEKTKQITINVMGEVQAEIIKEVLSSRFLLDVKLENMSIIYKEKPIKTGKGQASFTSVSRVEFEISPMPKGSGISYEETQATIGKFSKSYAAKVKKLVFDYLQFGNYGWEVLDAKITLIAAAYDSVASEPMHFNIATPIALYRALREASTKILEPILTFKIIIPQNLFGEIQKPLSVNKASIFSSDIKNDKFIIEGEIAESFREKLIKEVRSVTHGLGECLFEFSHYGDTNLIINNKNIPYDVSNETNFVQNIMNESVSLLDKQPRRKHKVKYANRKFEDKF